MNSTRLKAAATARNGFRFDRLEDIAIHPDIEGRTFVADTGAAGDGARACVPVRRQPSQPDSGDDQDDPQRGRSGRRRHLQPRQHGRVRPRFDDPGGDRESAFAIRRSRAASAESWSTASRTSRCSPGTGRRAAAAGPGTWESSGIINAGDLLGRAGGSSTSRRTRPAPQPGPSLEPNSSTGEDGQFLALYVPAAGERRLTGTTRERGEHFVAVTFELAGTGDGGELVARAWGPADDLGQRRVVEDHIRRSLFRLRGLQPPPLEGVVERVVCSIAFAFGGASRLIPSSARKRLGFPAQVIVRCRFARVMPT